MVIAAIPQSSNRRARSTIGMCDSGPRPIRVLTVTGTDTRETTRRVMATMAAGSRSQPAPAPRPALLGTQHPQLMSMKSGFDSSATLAEESKPLFIDINCGCWVPKSAGRGAGAGWLRDPGAMVAMARMVVSRVSVPVTVKTRIGLGPESHMPIVDLARRLEDAGVAAITIHCRTAQMGHSGAADWSWAARAREGVRIPVIVKGDIRTAADAKRALEETGCAGVMVGRRAIEHPWVFREARALLDHGAVVAPPTPEERIALCREHLVANVAQREEPYGVHCTRRHLSGYLKGLHGAASLRQRLNQCDTLEGCLAILDGALVAADAAAA